MKTIARLSLLGLFLPRLAWSAFEAGTVIRQYDDGGTQVTSPKVEAKAIFGGDQLKLSFGYASDIVTSASSDVKSFASGEIEDTRIEYSTGFSWLIEGGEFSWYYIQSDENDYHSKTYSFGVSKEFNEKNTVIGIGFNKGDDNIQSSADPTFNELMDNHSTSFSVTQVLNKLSLIQFIYDFRIESGYLASPYRNARIQLPGGGIQGQDEVHPKTRNRNAFTIRYNYHLRPTSTSFSTSFRSYFDSWDVKSFTLEERISQQLTKTFTTTLSFRYYMQMAAKFYQDTYSSGNEAFMTGNKTLSDTTSYEIGVRPTFDFSESVSFFAKYEYYIQNFDNHTDVGKTNDPTDDKKLELKAQIIGIGLNAKF